MKLSILIPTIEKRNIFLKHLLRVFISQLFTKIDSKFDSIFYSENILAMLFDEAEIVINFSEKENIGTKRNDLLKVAKCEYICFFDDDDMPGDNYIKTLMEGIATNPDCISLRGIITTNGTDPQIFEHSIKYDAYKTTDNEIKYERYPNHLNCIRAEIAKQFKFPEINHGEDTDWATQIHKSGLLKKEYYTEEILYHYKYISNK